MTLLWVREEHVKDKATAKAKEEADPYGMTNKKGNCTAPATATTRQWQQQGWEEPFTMGGSL
jgi:hypothetical protein